MQVCKEDICILIICGKELRIDDFRTGGLLFLCRLLLSWKIMILHEKAWRKWN